MDTFSVINNVISFISVIASDTMKNDKIIKICERFLRFTTLISLHDFYELKLILNKFLKLNKNVINFRFNMHRVKSNEFNK